jgi:hypothetical protein
MPHERPDGRPQIPETRHRSSIKQQVSALIRTANRVEAASPSTDGTGRFKPAMKEPPTDLIASQLKALALITAACESGMNIEKIQTEVVGPVIEEAIVGDLARASIRQVMAAATARFRRGGAAGRVTA